MYIYVCIYVYVCVYTHTHTHTYIYIYTHKHTHIYIYIRCTTINSKKSEKYQGGFPGSSAGKETAYSAGDLGSIPGLGRSFGEGNSYPLQYSGLENSMDCTVHGVTKSRTPLSDFHFHNKQGARCFKI